MPSQSAPSHRASCPTRLENQIEVRWRASLARIGTLAVEGVGVLAALVALLVEGFFDYHFWNAALTVEIALLITLAVALGSAAKSRDAVA